MSSFSGVPFFCFVLLRFRLYAFVEAATLRSIVLRYAGAPIATRVFFFFYEMSLFPSIFCTISAFSLYGEYVVRSFLPDGVFLPCDHGLDFFYISLCDNSINQSIIVEERSVNLKNTPSYILHMYVHVPF